MQDSGAGFGHPPCGDFPCGGPPSGQPSPLEHLCDCPPRIVNSGSGAYRSEHLQGSVLGVAPRRNCLGQILQSPKLLSDSSQTFPCPSEQSAARYPASKPLRRETDTSTTDWWSVPSLPSDLIASRRAVHSTRIALRQTQRTPSSYSDLASPSVFAEVGDGLGIETISTVGHLRLCETGSAGPGALGLGTWEAPSDLFRRLRDAGDSSPGPASSLEVVPSALGRLS